MDTGVTDVRSLVSRIQAQTPNPILSTTCPALKPLYPKRWYEILLVVFKPQNINNSNGETPLVRSRILDWSIYTRWYWEVNGIVGGEMYFFVPRCRKQGRRTSVVIATLVQRSLFQRCAVCITQIPRCCNQEESPLWLRQMCTTLERCTLGTSGAGTNRKNVWWHACGEMLWRWEWGWWRGEY